MAFAFVFSLRAIGLQVAELLGKPFVYLHARFQTRVVR